MAGRALNIVRDMVRIESYQTKDRPYPEIEVIEYLSRRFDRAGIPYTLQTDDEGRLLNVVASIGEGEPSIMLNGHMDVVPPGDLRGWSHDPFEARVVGDRLYGRGACDAKGSLGCMVAAVERLWEERDELQGRIVLSAVSAEETGGLGTRWDMAQGTRTQVAIVGEPTSCVPHIAHKGGLRVWVDVKGESGHAGRPGDGVNAIYGAAPLIAAFEELGRELLQSTHHPLLGPASLVVTTVQGGTALNVVPESCSLTLDRRLLPGEDDSQALEQIRQRIDEVGKKRPEVEFEISKSNKVLPAETSSEELVGLVEAVSRDVLGRSVKAEGFSATCDMTYIEHQGGIPTLILGPGDLKYAHQPDEWVPLEELDQAAEIYYQVCRRWLTR